jgi:hypothetical protein
MSLKEYLRSWHKATKEEGFEIAFFVFFGLLVLAYFADLTVSKIKRLIE